VKKTVKFVYMCMDTNVTSTHVSIHENLIVGVKK
jgi:hypothetical protein